MTHSLKNDRLRDLASALGIIAAIWAAPASAEAPLPPPAGVAVESIVPWARPDVEASIEALPDSPSEKITLRQLSSVLSGALVIDLSERAALQRALKRIAAVVACLHSRYSAETAVNRSLQIEEWTINTPERRSAYQHFMEAVAGMRIPDASQTACSNFTEKPDATEEGVN